MLHRLLLSLRPIRLYALVLLLPLGWFVWGGLTNTRLLGDDNESTETLAAPGTTGRAHTGHGVYYHK
jgi:hypothetical protein